MDKIKVNNSFDAHQVAEAGGHTRNLSMQNNLNTHKMSSRTGLMPGLMSDTKLEHINTSGTSSRMASAERHRGLWPSIEDHIQHNK